MFHNFCRLISASVTTAESLILWKRCQYIWSDPRGGGYFGSVRLFLCVSEIFLIFANVADASNHIDTWQASPYGSSGDTGQVGKWSSNDNSYLDNLEKLDQEHNWGKWLSNPHPWARGVWQGVRLSPGHIQGIWQHSTPPSPVTATCWINSCCSVYNPLLCRSSPSCPQTNLSHEMCTLFTRLLKYWYRNIMAVILRRTSHFAFSCIFLKENVLPKSHSEFSCGSIWQEAIIGPGNRLIMI